jgi:hypothetical protein
MRRILNFLTYWMTVCFTLTTLIALTVFQKFLLNAQMTMYPKSLPYKDFWDIVLWAGLMLLQGVIISYSYTFWKTHIRLEK